MYFSLKIIGYNAKIFASKVIPGIIFSNIRENNISKIENKNSFSSERIKNKTFKRVNKTKKIKFNICKKFGHSTKAYFFNKYNNKRDFTTNKTKFNKFNKKSKNYNNMNYKHKRIHALSTNIRNNKNKYNKNYEKYKNDYLDVFTQDFNSNLNLESNYIEKQNNNNIINNNTHSDQLTM